MYEQTVVVTNKSGLHARPAAQFAAEARKHASKVTVVNMASGKAADAKSIIKVLTLGITAGTEITVRAEGEDEKAAVDDVVALVKSGCGE